MKNTKGKQARENSSSQTGQWSRKVISIEKNAKQSGIEVTFDSPGPSPWLQVKLRAKGFRNSKRKVMWYADDTEEHNAFAEEIRNAIQNNEDGPELILWPSVEPLKANLEKKEYCFVMFTLKNGQTKNYLVFEPSKPKAELIASNFGAHEFGEQLNVFAVLPKTRIKEARALFASEQIIYPDEQSRFIPIVSEHAEVPADKVSAVEQLTGSKVPVKTIFLSTIAYSRTPDYTKGVELHTWREANEYVKSKIGTYSDVYYNVEWMSGDRFNGWIDIEPPDFYNNIADPLSRHIRSYLTNYAKIDDKHFLYSAENLEHAQHLLDTCLFEDLPENDNTIEPVKELPTDASIDPAVDDNTAESLTDRKRSEEIEALSSFYKWAVLNGKLGKITLDVMTEWFHENKPELSAQNISNIWNSHLRIEQSQKIKIKAQKTNHPFDTIYKKILKIIPGLIEHIKEGKIAGKSDKDPEGGLMPLNFDFLYYDKNGDPVIALSHYFKQNGDMIADPDMQIRLMPGKEMAEAMTYQDQFGYKYVYAEKEGRTFVNASQRKDLNTFLNQWLTNLIHQGHTIDLGLGDEEGHNYYRDAWELLAKLVPALNDLTNRALMGRALLPANGKPLKREITCILSRTSGGRFSLGLMEKIGLMERLRYSVGLNEESHTVVVDFEWFADGVAVEYGRNESQKQILKRDGDVGEEQIKGLILWLEEVLSTGVNIDIPKVADNLNIKDASSEVKKEAPAPEPDKKASAILTGTPVFDPAVMVQLINAQNYLVNAWSLSHPKSVLSKSRFDAGDFANLHAFFSIYVQEDSAMQVYYLDLYRKIFTATVNLTFQDTDAPLPNVLVPIGTKEPFLSHGFKAYDMRSMLESQFPKLSALTNETLGLASPVQLYELAQLGNPKMYHIAVSQDKLVDIWRTRGKELFDTLGFPTNPYYPYADLIAGYENMMPLRDLLNDSSTPGNDWWVAAAIYRPIADLEKAQAILDELIQKKELEKKTYLTADGERPRPNYKSRVEQMDRTIGYLKESQAVLQAYAHQTELQHHKDHLTDENGIYNQKSAGDNIEELTIPIPPEAQYHAEVSIVRSSTGYRIGLSASKNFGAETYSGIMPRQTDKAYVSRQDALEAALQIHIDWLEEALSKPDADDDALEQNAQRLQLAIDAIETFALHNDITLNINQSQSDQDFTNHPYDALANDSGVYTHQSAGKNFETLQIPMPKASGYDAQVFLVLTSTDSYKEGIHCKKAYGDNLGLSFFPSVRDESYTTRKDALKAALLHHEQELLIMLGSKDTILNNESTKRKRLSLALNALQKFAKEQGIDLSPTPDKEEDANLVHKTPATNDDIDNEEIDPPKKSDPLADDRGHYTSFSAGRNFETIHIPMPKSSGYEANVYLVLTSEGTYKDGIMRCKSFGAYSYVSEFPSVGAASYRTRKSALKAALLHHEQELEVLMGHDDSFLKNQDIKTKKLQQAMKALYQFAGEQGISMEAIPDPTDLKIELVQGLENAYWQGSDNEDLKNLVTIMGVKFHQSRLRNAISKKLNELPLTLLKEIVSELTNRFSAAVSLDEHRERLSKSTKQVDETNERRWMVVYVDDLIFNNDVYPDNQRHPVMTFLIEQLYSGAARLADLPQNTAGKQEQEKPIKKKQSQNRLNKEIEALIDQKDEVGADYSEEEKSYLLQYTGSGGLLSEGAQGRGTLYEYYTPDSIVKRMWDMAYHYGYDGGSILEPAVGTGHFLKYAPKNVSITGYETNHYACRISQIVYPHAQIHERAFETQFFAGNIHLRENFDNPHYSLVIGNPPYGSFTGKYAGLGEKKQTGASEYDQYFLLRSLDLLKPGGLLVFLISSYFMLSMQKYNSIKEKINAKAELVDGYRLPANALPNTDVGTDIIVLRRKK